MKYFLLMILNKKAKLVIPKTTIQYTYIVSLFSSKKKKNKNKIYKKIQKKSKMLQNFEN